MNEDDKFALFHVLSVIGALIIFAILAIQISNHTIRFDKRPDITE